MHTFVEAVPVTPWDPKIGSVECQARSQMLLAMLESSMTCQTEEAQIPSER